MMFGTFEEVAGEPLTWWLQARHLLLAAYAIRDAHRESFQAYFNSVPAEGGWVKLTQEQSFHLARLGIAPVFSLLVGLAFENKMKGILVARDKSLISGGTLSDKLTTKRHNLLSLCDKVGLEISTEDRDLFRRLSESVHWAGRYPVPRREHERELRQIPGKGLSLPGSVYMDEDEIRITDLWKRLDDLIIADPRCPKYHNVGPEESNATHNTVGRADA